MKRFPQPSPNELVFGFIYYLLQLLVIPGILVGINMIVPTFMTEAILNFICFAINFVAVLIIFRKFLSANWQPVRQQPWYVLRCAGIGFLIYLIGSTIFSYLVIIIDPDFANVNDVAITQMVADNFMLMTIGTVFLVPLAEECFYRVLIFRGIYDKSPLWAYIVSMVYFSLAHILVYVTVADIGTLVLCFFQYLPAGFALAWSYQKSGTIYAPILIHMSVNQMGMLLLR